MERFGKNRFADRRLRAIDRNTWAAEGGMMA
jgi:hypothetical protein